MLMGRVVTYAYFLIECAVFFFTLDAIDILCLVYSNFCSSKIILKIYLRFFWEFWILFYMCTNMNEALSIKRIQSQQKSTYSKKIARTHITTILIVNMKSIFNFHWSFEEKRKVPSYNNLGISLPETITNILTSIQ